MTQNLKRNKYNFRYCEDKIRRIELDLPQIQNDAIPDKDGVNENALLKDLEEYHVIDELIWKHKSRENWLSFDDRNTKFFNTSTMIRRRRNTSYCKMIRVDGFLIELKLVIYLLIISLRNFVFKSSLGFRKLAMCKVLKFEEIIFFIISWSFESIIF